MWSIVVDWAQSTSYLTSSCAMDTTFLCVCHICSLPVYVDLLLLVLLFVHHVYIAASARRNFKTRLGFDFDLLPFWLYYSTLHRCVCVTLIFCHFDYTTLLYIDVCVTLIFCHFDYTTPLYIDVCVTLIFCHFGYTTLLYIDVCVWLWSFAILAILLYIDVCVCVTLIFCHFGYTILLYIDVCVTLIFCHFGYTTLLYIDVCVCDFDLLPFWLYYST